MRIIGCDFHSRYQQIAMLETGEVQWAPPPFARREIEIKLMMENGEVSLHHADAVIDGVT